MPDFPSDPWLAIATLVEQARQHFYVSSKDADAFDAALTTLREQMEELKAINEGHEAAVADLRRWLSSSGYAPWRSRPAYLRGHEEYEAGLRTHLTTRLEQAEGLREALVSIATKRQETDDWDHPGFDWKLLATKQERIARTALSTGEPAMAERCPDQRANGIQCWLPEGHSGAHVAAREWDSWDVVETQETFGEPSE